MFRTDGPSTNPPATPATVGPTQSRPPTPRPSARSASGASLNRFPLANDVFAASSREIKQAQKVIDLSNEA